MTDTLVCENDCVDTDAANVTGGTVPVVPAGAGGVGATVGSGVVGAVGATVGSDDGVADGVELGVDVATGAGVGTEAASAAAGATTTASERPAARVTAVTAARILFMVFGFSLGEGFFGYAHEGNVWRRGGRRQIVGGTTGAEQPGGCSAVG